MSPSDRQPRTEEERKRDRAIWTIYLVMIAFILAPLVFFLVRHVL